jgi:hypothetical protein
MTTPLPRVISRAAIRMARRWRDKRRLTLAPAKRLLVEALEQRILLSGGLSAAVSDIASRLDTSRITGVTVITHGFQPEYISDGDSLLGLGKAIVNFERYSDAETANSQDWAWLLDYDIKEEGTPGYFDLAQSSKDLPGVTDTVLDLAGELVLVYDWAVESNEHAPGWTDAAGDGLFALLTSLHVVDPENPANSKPLHFIAHSFGAAVTSETVERLAYFGVPVDQVTLLDPHDFNQGIAGVDTFQGQYTVGQPTGYGATKWENVSFMDVYFQTRGLNGALVPDFVVPDGRPIPGAYNRFLDNELPSAYGNFDTSGDHSYAWSVFYASSIPGALTYDLASNSFLEQVDIDGDGAKKTFVGPASPGSFASLSETHTGGGTYGFGFSRLAQGVSLRPEPMFYGLGADDIAAHEWTPEALKPLTAAAAGRAEPLGGYAPLWLPYGTANGSGVLVNGDFSNPGEFLSLDVLSDGQSVTIPGWTNHGGGGGAQVPRLVGLEALRLSSVPIAGAPTLDPRVRVHDTFYLPFSASHLSFQLSGLVHAAGAKLQVFIADDNLVAPDASVSIPANLLPLAEIMLAGPLPGGIKTYIVPLKDTSLAGRTHTLAFRLVDAGNSAKVLLDDVKFLSLASARSADVLEVNLGTLQTAAGIGGAAVIDYDIRGLGLQGAVIAKLENGIYSVNAAPNADGTAGVPWGRLVLSDVYDANQVSFAASGRLLFIPYLPDLLNRSPSDAAAFEGSFALSYRTFTNPQLAEQQKFEYTAGNFVTLVNIRGNSSPPDAEERIGQGTGVLDTFRLQQRLRAMGYPGSTGNALLVDGKLGANTRSAIGLFNAVVGGYDSATVTDKIDLAWINDPRSPGWRTLVVADPAQANSDRISLFASGNSRWGSSWTEEILAAAGQSLALPMGQQYNFELTQAAKMSGVAPRNGVGQWLVFETMATNYATTPATLPGDLAKPTAQPFLETVTQNGLKLIKAADSTDTLTKVLVRNSAGQVASVTLAQATAAGNTRLVADDVLKSRVDLLAIKGMFKYASAYHAATVLAQINALKSARTTSGAKVGLIYSGDPGTWDGDGKSGIVRFEAGDPDKPRRFEEPHLGGTFEVQIVAPSRRPGPQEQAALSGFVTAAERIFDFIGQLPEWAREVPLVGGVLADLLPMEELVGKLMRATFGPLVKDANLSVERLRELLSGDKKTVEVQIPQADGSSKTVGYSFGQKAGSDLKIVVTDAAIRIEGLQLVAERKDPVALNLGLAASDLGLKITDNTYVDLKQTWAINLGFEYRRDPSLTTEQAMAIRQLTVDGGRWAEFLCNRNQCEAAPGRDGGQAQRRPH